MISNLLKPMWDLLILLRPNLEKSIKKTSFSKGLFAAKNRKIGTLVLINMSNGC